MSMLSVLLEFEDSSRDAISSSEFNTRMGIMNTITSELSAPVRFKTTSAKMDTLKFAEGVERLKGERAELDFKLTTQATVNYDAETFGDFEASESKTTMVTANLFKLVQKYGEADHAPPRAGLEAARTSFIRRANGSRLPPRSSATLNAGAIGPSTTCDAEIQTEDQPQGAALFDVSAETSIALNGTTNSVSLDQLLQQRLGSASASPVASPQRAAKRSSPRMPPAMPTFGATTGSAPTPETPFRGGLPLSAPQEPSPASTPPSSFRGGAPPQLEPDHFVTSQPPTPEQIKMQTLMSLQEARGRKNVEAAASAERTSLASIFSDATREMIKLYPIKTHSPVRMTSISSGKTPASSPFAPRVPADSPSAQSQGGSPVRGSPARTARASSPSGTLRAVPVVAQRKQVGLARSSPRRL